MSPIFRVNVISTVSDNSVAVAVNRWWLSQGLVEPLICGADWSWLNQPHRLLQYSLLNHLCYCRFAFVNAECRELTKGKRRERLTRQKIFQQLWRKLSMKVWRSVKSQEIVALTEQWHWQNRSLVPVLLQMMTIHLACTVTDFIWTLWMSIVHGSNAREWARNGAIAWIEKPRNFCVNFVLANTYTFGFLNSLV